jgi:hypothetical protein
VHAGGPVLRSLLGRANTWQMVLVAVALTAIGAVLAAFGQLRGGIIGVVGLLLLVGIARRRFGRPREAHPTTGDAEEEQS